MKAYLAGLMAIGLIATPVWADIPAPSKEVDLWQASGTILDVEGKLVGTLNARRVASGVLLQVEVTLQDNGAHGFHIHETGLCEGPDFTSAGGHFNPTGSKHGLNAEDGHHAGDLPNLYAKANEPVVLEVIVPGVKLLEGPHPLLDKDGAAVIIHAAKDDYITDPTGDAGKRIACGVIKRKAGEK